MDPGLDIDPDSYCSGGPGINKTVRYWKQNGEEFHPNKNKQAVDVEHYGGPGPLSGFPGVGTTGNHGVISDHPTDCEYGDDLLVNNGGEKSNGVETLTTSEMDSFVNLRKYATEVQQPSKEDLQPSYAYSLTGQGDQDAHGWYGNMSKPDTCTAQSNWQLTLLSQLSRVMHWDTWCYPMRSYLS